MVTEKQQFGARLRELREAKGMSQEALGKAIGKTWETVSRWERGVREPAWSNIVALCSALGVDCTAFTEEPGEQPNSKRGRPPKTATTEEPATKPKAKRPRRKKGDA